MKPTATRGWQERRGAALALRVVAVGLPAALSATTAVVAGHLLPAPPTLGWAVARLALILAGSTAVMVLVRLVTRRLLPLSMLLSLSLAFPDATPGRLKVAMRTPSARQLQAAVAVASGDVAGGPDTGGPETGGPDTVSRLLALVAAISAHHRLTRGHSERVRAYADLIAVELGLGPGERDMVRWAALLHDLGKVTVPTAILDKPGRPDADEWAVLAGHPAASARLAAPLRDWMGEWWFGIGQHHEKWDGSGYPDGLAGDAIARSGRIVALADAFETMTALRSYKRPMSIEAARAEVVRCAGSHFDPAVVRAFLNIGLRPLHRVAGVASWVPVPLVALLLPLRSYAMAASAGVNQAGTAVAVGVAAAAGGLMVDPTASAHLRTDARAGTVWEATAASGTMGATAPTTGAIGRGSAGRASAPAAAVAVTASSTSAPPGAATTTTTAGAGPGGVEAPGTAATSPGPSAPSTGPTAVPPAGGSSTTVAAPVPPSAPRAGTTGAPPIVPPPTTGPATTSVATTPAPPPPAPPPPAPPPPPAVPFAVANDEVTATAGASVVAAPLANDTGVDATTLTIVRVDADLVAVVQGGGTIRITVAPGAKDNGSSVRYRVCAPGGGPCAEARIRVRLDA